MKEMNTWISIKSDYDKTHALHDEFTRKMENLVQELLNDSSIQIHSVTHRLKGLDSLKRKCEKSPEKFKTIKDIYDICGVRIITYFNDDVEKVARIIEKEFAIDSEQSGNKIDLLDPDRFGYLSLHYVAKLTPTRLKLHEYRRFSDCSVEVQIRSILQHAWAEIEHDLGYKSKQSIPAEIRRRFARLAGLLELADSEFIYVRDDIEQYKQRLPKRIAKNPDSVPLDKVSIVEYAKTSRLVNTIEKEFVNSIKGTHDISERFFETTVGNLLHLGNKTIGDVDAKLGKYKETIIKFFQHLQWEKGGTITIGLSLHYLSFVQAADEKSLEGLKEILTVMRAPKSQVNRIANEIWSVYRKAIK